MKLSVILPIKNQSALLIKNIQERIIPFYDALGVVYELIIVDDGSDIDNQKIMNDGMKKMPLQVKLLPYEDIKGKGHNVSKGILASTGDYCMFMDADLASDLHTIDPVIKTLSSYDCYVASRHMKGSQMPKKATIIRRMISLLSRQIIKLSFHFKGISDTQCGYKIFRTSVIKKIAERSIVDGFAFDVEYLYFLSLNGFSIKQIPVLWNDGEKSTIHSPLSASFHVLRDLFRIKAHKKAYLLTKEEKASLEGHHVN
jgi:dolichyl-phosphate beta-glucosyltransferase